MPALLSAALESVMMQNLWNVEVVIVHDGSTKTFALKDLFFSNLLVKIFEVPHVAE